MKETINSCFKKCLSVGMENEMKKKFWKPPSFEDFNSSLPNKKIKLEIRDYQNKSQDIPNEPKEPKAVSELAIHPKKIGEISNWIKWSRNEKAPILLLTGPAGSGKTTTIKVSASEEKLLVKEWVNPIDKTEFKLESVFQTEMYDKCSFSETKQTDKFEDFVFRSSRYKSLFDVAESILILVEDIPNIFVWRPKLFHNFLDKYKNDGKSPIVFIITDDQNLNLSNSLFPNHIKNKYNITNIKFNPVNHSLLVKNLKTLSDTYCPEKVSSQLLENIIKNSGGDLRSATNNLLLFLRTSSLSLNQLTKKGKKMKKNDSFGRHHKPLSKKGCSFDFYHLIGRILYPKLKLEKEKVESLNPHLVFVHNVHQIAEGWTLSFLKILHENYLQTFSKLKDVVEGADCFSFCDVLSNTQNLDNYVSLIGVITLMLKNTEPKKTGFNPLKMSLQVEHTNCDSNVEVDKLYCCQLKRRDYLLDVNPFLKILKNYKNKQNFDEMCSQVKYSCNESDEDMIEIEEFDD